MSRFSVSSPEQYRTDWITGNIQVHLWGNKDQRVLLIFMRGFKGGIGRAAAPLFWRSLHKIYNKNTKMNVQVLFSGPHFSRIGVPALTF